MTTTVYFPITLSESAVAVWTPEASQTVPAGSTHPISLPTSCPVLTGRNSHVIGTAASPTVVTDTTLAAGQPVSMAISYRCEYNVTELTSTTATKASGFSNDGASKIVIGTLAGVAALLAMAGLLGYYFMRRSRARHVQQERDRLQRRKGAAFTGFMKFYLLQGAHVGWGGIRKNFEEIHLSFDNVARGGFDHQKVIPNSISLNKSLEPLGLSENRRNLICELVTEPRTRRIGIRHVLAWAIFSNLDIRSVGPLSLLHPAIKNFMLYVPKNKREPKEYSDPMDHGKNPMDHEDVIQNAWRQLSAVLLQERPFASLNHHFYDRFNPHLDSQIETLVNALSGFFDHLPMLDGVFMYGWTPALRSLISRSAYLCYIIASDPGNWEITLPPPSPNYGICVFPGLTLLSDNERDPLDRPQVFIMPEVEKVDHVGKADRGNNAEAQTNTSTLGSETNEEAPLQGGTTSESRG
ncbi:hypothetical protein MAJ_09406, partial [Metarhizium majus ARSEF 297]